MGHATSHRMVAELLHELGYSLQANRKTEEGKGHPDRDAQFEHINRQGPAAFQRPGQPVVSVDTKKKELVGDFKNAGREWQPEGQPGGGASPRLRRQGAGQGDPLRGLRPDAATRAGSAWGSITTRRPFAVARRSAGGGTRWGRRVYPRAERLLITADGGGSNGSRVPALEGGAAGAGRRDWGCEITVCHFPPGTSKWNKIEHRMFCHITQNWRGRPLVSREVVVNLIAATTTETGLKVTCELDRNRIPRGSRSRRGDGGDQV